MADMVMHESLLGRMPVAEERFYHPYVDENAGLKAQNKRLWIVILSISAAFLGVVVFFCTISYEMANQKPPLLLAHPSGQVTTAPWSLLTDSKPEESTVRYALIQFTEDHHGRNRKTLREAFLRKMYYLPEEVSERMMRDERASQSNIRFLNGTDPDIECVVTNVALDLISQPWKAQVDYELIYKHPIGGNELRREQYKSNMQFERLDKLLPSYVKHNPLGLVVTYAKEYQWFTDPK